MYLACVYERLFCEGLFDTPSFDSTTGLMEVVIRVETNIEA